MSLVLLQLLSHAQAPSPGYDRLLRPLWRTTGDRHSQLVKDLSLTTILTEEREITHEGAESLVLCSTLWESRALSSTLGESQIG